MLVALSVHATAPPQPWHRLSLVTSNDCIDWPTGLAWWISILEGKELVGMITEIINHFLNLIILWVMMLMGVSIEMWHLSTSAGKVKIIQVQALGSSIGLTQSGSWLSVIIKWYPDEKVWQLNNYTMNIITVLGSILEHTLRNTTYAFSSHSGQLNSKSGMPGYNLDHSLSNNSFTQLSVLLKIREEGRWHEKWTPSKLHFTNVPTMFPLHVSSHPTSGKSGIAYFLLICLNCKNKTK
jgi:hypothetical protein